MNISVYRMSLQTFTMSAPPSQELPLKNYLMSEGEFEGWSWSHQDLNQLDPKISLDNVFGWGFDFSTIKHTPA